jgi:transcriptional regulator with XRE-family HTH domain
MRLYVTVDVPNSSIINVKKLRENRNLTIRKVATAMDVAESTIYRWEAGIVKPQLPLEKVQIMLDLFECDFTTLYTAFKQTALESQQQTDQMAVKGEEKQPIAV